MDSNDVNSYRNPWYSGIHWKLVSWIPRRVMLWCLVRALAEFDPQYSWETRKTAAYWRVLDYAVWRTFEKELTFSEWSESE